VRAQGTKIFVQLMHTGRIGHPANLPAGARVLGPAAAPCSGQMYTDALGLQPHPAPQPMSVDDIKAAIAEFAHAATLAVQAGFDGIELHAANGYLLEQFLNANVNTRTDDYGGSAANRLRLVLEVARATVEAIGPQRVGIRLSPFGVFNDTGSFDGVEDQYLVLARELSALRLVYLHLVDHSALGAPEVPAAFKARLQTAFAGTFIASGGFDHERAERVLAEGRADLVAFGRPWIANPDLVERMRDGIALATPDPATFYSPGTAGYTDYPRAA
jgi:N-ethylmaleimide reductase